MIQIKKGLDLPIQGNPKNVISESPRVTSCGILGPDYIGMKPTMLVKEGDQVLGGEALFEDKKNPGNFFTSPTSGIVTAINRGEQRRLLSVEIDLDGKNLNKQFNFPDDKSAQIEALTKSGQFNYFRTRPFNKIPSINSFPNEIFINACNSNPNSNDPFIYINQEQDLFDFGLKTLKNLYDCTIHVCYSHDDFQQNINNVNYHQFIGPHPSGLSGTHIHYISPVNEKSKTWYLDAQGLLSIAHFFKHAEIRNHKYDTENYIVNEIYKLDVKNYKANKDKTIKSIYNIHNIPDSDKSIINIFNCLIVFEDFLNFKNVITKQSGKYKKNNKKCPTSSSICSSVLPSTIKSNDNSIVQDDLYNELIKYQYYIEYFSTLTYFDNKIAYFSQIRYI